ncbi:uroporphyrinogen-III synthase [Novosphingobium sp.]|uniref:uroporphyrinogen-III synthase n=1 Tax=Novosphingobium sp. TaxID=1874826 RepID=UPI0035AE9548
MSPLIVIRPEPGNSATVAAARAAGLEAHGFPLFSVSPRKWEVPDPARYDAMLAGSANVFRHAGAGLSALRRLPVYAVGDTTAEAARAAGFKVAYSGTGGLQAVLGELAPAHKRLLRLAGEERIALAMPPGVALEERVVYASEACPLPEELATMLRQDAIVTLHSAEAARHLAAQCVTHGIRRAPIRIAALGPRIANAAGTGWGEVAIAALASDHALLALARQMCQDPAPNGRPK